MRESFVGRPAVYKFETGTGFEVDFREFVLTKPTEEQKRVLREQLSQMSGDQWLAMVRWILLELACDQEYFANLLLDELERRKRREVETSAKDSTNADHLLSIMKDLKLRIVPEGMR